MPAARSARLGKGRPGWFGSCLEHRPIASAVWPKSGPGDMPPVGGSWQLVAIEPKTGAVRAAEVVLGQGLGA